MNFLNESVTMFLWFYVGNNLLKYFRKKDPNYASEVFILIDSISLGLITAVFHLYIDVNFILYIIGIFLCFLCGVQVSSLLTVMIVDKKRQKEQIIHETMLANISPERREKMEAIKNSLIVLMAEGLNDAATQDGVSQNEQSESEETI